jgi:hypothetical protein
VLIPSVCLLLCQLFQIHFSNGPFIWIILSFFVIGLGFNQFREDLKRLSLLTRKEKIFLMVMALFLAGLIQRNFLIEVWPGDGIGPQWGLASLDWMRFGRIQFSETLLKTYPQYVSYPIYHRLGQTFNLLTLPISRVFSLKIFDAIYFIGIILCFISILWKETKNVFLCFTLSILACFLCRDLADAIGSGYAEIDLAYFLLLGTIGFITKLPAIFIGLAFALASITKNEALYRSIIIISSFFIFDFIQNRKKVDWKKYLFILLPIIGLKLLNHQFTPENTYNHYYKDLTLTLDNLISRFSLLISVFKIHFTKDVWYKNFWLLSFLFLPKIISKIIKNKNFLWATIFMAWLGNFLFSFLPSWIADYHTDITYLAFAVILRINTQSYHLLALVIVFLLIDSWKNQSYKRPIYLPLIFYFFLISVLSFARYTNVEQLFIPKKSIRVYSLDKLQESPLFYPLEKFVPISSRISFVGDDLSLERAKFYFWPIMIDRNIDSNIRLYKKIDFKKNDQEKILNENANFVLTTLSF